MSLQEFRIIPVLGRKTAVPADDASLFKVMDREGRVALTHDVGGVNFDLTRKKNTCSKSFGYSQWSNSANAQATKCMGLFELYDGTNRNHLFFDNGKVYYYDASIDPVEIAASPAVTFANDNQDIYSIIQVGEYMVWADRAENYCHMWKHGDANLTRMIFDGNSGGSGTEYKFRYLECILCKTIGHSFLYFSTNPS